MWKRVEMVEVLWLGWIFVILTIDKLLKTCIRSHSWSHASSNWLTLFFRIKFDPTRDRITHHRVLFANWMICSSSTIWNYTFDGSRAIITFRIRARIHESPHLWSRPESILLIWFPWFKRTQPILPLNKILLKHRDISLTALYTFQEFLLMSQFIFELIETLSWICIHLFFNSKYFWWINFDNN